MSGSTDSLLTFVEILDEYERNHLFSNCLLGMCKLLYSGAIYWGNRQERMSGQPALRCGGRLLVNGSFLCS